MAEQERQQRVAVVYHFFAHYRGPVMQALADSPVHDYTFVGSKTDVHGDSIKGWDIPDGSPFIETKWVCFPGGVDWQRGLIRLALRRDFDTIIYLGNPRWPSTWIASIVARMAGKRVFFWTIGWYHADSKLNSWLKRRFFGLANGLMLYGRAAKKIAVAQGFDPQKVHVVYNSLDYATQKKERANVTEAQISAVREKHFDHPEWPIAICISRLTNKRRLDWLIEAAGKLKEQGHPLNILLVGEGEGDEKEKLESMARDADVPVCFYGACYDEQVLATLTMAANVTVAPGMVGLTAMQSMAFGTPVITHNDMMLQSPESEVIIPGYNGDLFEHGDTDDLAACIKRWTQTSRVDETTRSHCYEIIDRFYNPEFQRCAIDRAVSGELPNDAEVEDLGK